MGDKTHVDIPCQASCLPAFQHSSSAYRLDPSHNQIYAVLCCCTIEENYWLQQKNASIPWGAQDVDRSVSGIVAQHRVQSALLFRLLILRKQAWAWADLFPGMPYHTWARTDDVIDPNEEFRWWLQHLRAQQPNQRLISWCSWQVLARVTECNARLLLNSNHISVPSQNRRFGPIILLCVAMQIPKWKRESLREPLQNNR